ncbi:cyclin-A1-4-like isoform X2 [Zingiber officinale]|uniref:cyclin-A1-4-like isoform X2 n=1 Tax=Zingiber officinale TaxID=94328 RepID=UPI001C4C6645|nr:cyclin-A1-4-like isoform X2 [Zingiber officinale]
MNLRSSFSSSALLKRPEASENPSKLPEAVAGQFKNGIALGNITNKMVVAKGGNKPNIKKRPTTSNCDSGSKEISSFAPVIVRTDTVVANNQSSILVNDEENVSSDSVSLNETMSSCNSMKSPVEYVDNGDSQAIASLERRSKENLLISEGVIEEKGSKCNINISTTTEVECFIDADRNSNNPQICTTLACDIYGHLRMAETKKRPSMDFMEVVQTDIKANMRSILVNWLVEVAEEYQFEPDTLYLTVNYIDRYLSVNDINRQRLQLLGVACMLIASKYVEICAPQVEEFCYLTDNTYFKDEVLQMEAEVSKCLKFEMSAPTAKCFLRRFIRAAQASFEVPTMQIESLANYVTELSLLEYKLLRYAPSVIAASAIFLAKFIWQPTKRPWNATLSRYTLYKPSDLCNCVKALHGLLCASAGSKLLAIRDKYSQPGYMYVAKKHCPASIPPEFFQDQSEIGPAM